MKEKSVDSLEKIIKYKFNSINYLKTALTHSSFANEKHMRRETNNERLEFLGDAVLEIITSDYLFHEFPELPEGELTKKRASIVCEPTLALCANDIFLGQYLKLGKGEDMTGGRERASIVSDAMEALIGAIYLDGGFANAKEFVDNFILKDIENKQLFYDSKTILQEIVQSRHDGNLEYVLIGEEGPDHNKQFIVEAHLDERLLAKGTGRTKKAAEQEAAYKSILLLRNNKNEE